MTNQGEFPVLYHGTRLSAARSIIQNGLRRGSSPNYTGTGVRLSECITIAYEYGAYETRGCVLEVKLSPGTNWQSISAPMSGEEFDDHFSATGLDALKTFGGNVWILWNAGVVQGARILPHSEALKHLAEEFESDGSDMAYNGVVDEYANVWWGRNWWNRGPAFEQEHRRLDRAMRRACGDLPRARAVHAGPGAEDHLRAARHG